LKFEIATKIHKRASNDRDQIQREEMSVITVTSDEHFETLLKQYASDTLCLNFWASFAQPSLQMNTVFAELATQFQATRFLQIDAEELEDISESFDVNAVPFFVVMRGTEVLSRISGANPQELQKALRRASPDAATPAAQETHVETVKANQASQTQPSAGAGAPTDVTDEEGEEDLNERLKKLTTAAPVMIFIKGVPSAPQCGFSRTLVSLLRAEGIHYGFFNILADNSVRQGLKSYSEWPTFPQVYVKGEFLGGLDVVREMIENGEMKDVLDEAGIKTTKS
jgi:Grx4 family monothiol glutaredoxin